MSEPLTAEQRIARLEETVAFLCEAQKGHLTMIKSIASMCLQSKNSELAAFEMEVAKAREEAESSCSEDRVKVLSMIARLEQKLDQKRAGLDSVLKKLRPPVAMEPDKPEPPSQPGAGGWNYHTRTQAGQAKLGRLFAFKNEGFLPV